MLILMFTLPLPKHINEEKVLSKISLDEGSASATATIEEQMAYDTKHLRVPEIQWLGAYPSDAERYFIPKQCLLSLLKNESLEEEGTCGYWSATVQSTGIGYYLYFICLVI
ncbi:hypothetical protein Ahy_B08g091122 [Arachis hypogaea]|uniref:Topoisomerase 6 subunit A/Spo11 TOPRIM domain-containing protein n=1 Tax=Arachis hypogaea TaxID=3818 RepID=A0A444Y1G4_ARAHY|nr:hypothetical protein Ahy_B08g091122 [Arachis hypogaea]